MDKVIESIIKELHDKGFAWVGANNKFGGEKGRSKLKGYKKLKEIANLELNWFVMKNDTRLDIYMETDEFKSL